MLHWMSGHIRQDRIRNGSVREKAEIAPIVEKMVESYLRWFRHLWRTYVEVQIRRVDQIEGRLILRDRRRP